MKTTIQNSLIVLGSLTAIYLLWQTREKSISCCSLEQEQLNEANGDLSQKPGLAIDKKDHVSNQQRAKQNPPTKKENLQTHQTNSPADQNYDLLKWGTKEGIIDVADRFDSRKKEQQRDEGIQKESARISQVYRNAKKAQFKAKGIQINTEAALNKALSEDLQTTQFTISNTSDKTRPITLWNANKSVTISPPLPEDLAELDIQNTTTFEGIHPSAVIFNSVNGLIYVANQLSDSISVLDQNGGFIKSIKLSNSLMPGSFSPTALTVNSNRASDFYGHIYVVGSVACQVLEIDLNHQIQRAFTVGVRPVNILFNSSADSLYVTNLLDNSVSIVDLNSGQSRQIETMNQPYGIAIDQSDNVVVSSFSEKNLQRIYPNDDLRQFNTLTESVSQIVYQPKEHCFYLNAQSSNSLLIIDADNFQIRQTVLLAEPLNSLSYNEFNNLIYGIASNQVLAFSNEKLLDQVGFSKPIDQVAINPGNGALYTISKRSAAVHVINYNEQSAQIIVDEQLAERTKEFQNKPVRVSAARIFVSNPDELNNITLVRSTMTGNAISRIVSLANSQSPQNSPNIIDLNGMKNTSIDGQSGWEFDLSANQSITFLVAYRQFDSYYLLPNAS